MNPEMTNQEDQNSRSIAGYQQIIDGWVEPGDMAIPAFNNWPEGVQPVLTSWHGYCVLQGKCYVRVGDCMHIFRIYRKMPCPKQSDAHLEAENAAFRKAEAENKPYAERTWEESAKMEWCRTKDNEQELKHIGNGLFAAPAEPTKEQVEKFKALTHDEGKPPLANLPWEGIKAVSRVQAYGHRKYKDYNNFRKGMEVSRNLSCAVRHIAAYMEGESLDPESKESHLAHACCRLLFVLQNEHDKVAIDDRYKRP